MGEQPNAYLDSRLDPLTGVFNQEYLHERLEVEFKRARRYREPLSCLCLDIDDLAALNERQGEQAGDEVLVRVAEHLQRLVRDVDFVARDRRDEFIVVLPNTPLGGGVAAADKAVAMLAAAPLELDGDPVRVTVCVGVASYVRATMRSQFDLIAAARDAAAAAKERGPGSVSEMPLH